MLKHKPSVRFDPDNIEHIEAVYLMLSSGKQHPEIRFDVEKPFHNAVDMVRHIMAVRYASIVLGKEFVDVRIHDPLKATEADLQPKLEKPITITSPAISGKEEETHVFSNLVNVVRLNFGRTASAKH
jgi:hypothetical protein